MDGTIFFGKQTPRLAEKKILEHFPSHHFMLEMQNSDKDYLRLKITPPPVDDLFDELRHKFGVNVKKYTSDDSCIVEISNPLFDILVIRDTSKFLSLNGWILRVIQNRMGYSEEVEVLAEIKYDNDHPYGLLLAEHMVEFLNENKDSLPDEYKEIYTI